MGLFRRCGNKPGYQYISSAEMGKKRMEIRIALAGNPNCGKTTLFNSLTGSNQYVGNWPGVTVEKKKESSKGIKT